MRTISEIAKSVVATLTIACLWMAAVPVTPAWAGLDEELRSMTDAQRYTLMKAVAYGAPYDLGYTLAAIAWQESQAGSVPVNVNDPSFGPFHNKMDTVMRRVALKDTPYHRNLIATRLLNDFAFAASMAVAELLYWDRVHHGKWRRMVRSYNAGYNHSSKSADAYVGNIIEKVKAIKQSFRHQGNELRVHLRYLQAQFSRVPARPPVVTAAPALMTTALASKASM
jgi:hypothetical protein